MRACSAGALLSKGVDAVANLVQGWLTRYEDDNLGAVCELATLMVEVSRRFHNFLCCFVFLNERRLLGCWLQTHHFARRSGER